MKHLPLDQKLFALNRQRFAEKMPSGAIAIFVSNDEVPTNGDALYPFRQNSDLYWLCGINQEDTMVILFPGNPDPRFREVLVLVRPNELKEKWDGKRLRKPEATAISGMQTIVWLDSLDPQLQQWIHLADVIMLDTNENDRKSSLVPTRDYRYVQEVQARYPLHQYARAARLMKELRSVKTAYETGVVQTAVDITHKTFLRVMRFMRPGVMEYEVEAEILHSFISQRSDGPAYGSIIAAGDNARTLHYVSNNGVCSDGDLVLMDFGALYGGYAADLTRTIPVNGQFSPRQKEVYNACLHLLQYAKSLLKPGITLVDYTEKVGDEATKEFIRIGLLSDADVVNEDKDNRAYRKYLYHGISHHLGIDVHDLGTRTAPLQPGMLLTVEPGIYIEEEKLGIRIENNVWITENGNKDLFDGIPITVEEIEACMKN